MFVCLFPCLFPSYRSFSTNVPRAVAFDRDLFGVFVCQFFFDEFLPASYLILHPSRRTGGEKKPKNHTKHQNVHIIYQRFANTCPLLQLFHASHLRIPVECVSPFSSSVWVAAVRSEDLTCCFHSLTFSLFF